MTTKTTEKATLSDEFAGLVNHKCQVMKGCRKFTPGTNLSILKVNVNKWGKPYAIAVTNKGTEFIDPKWLKKGKALPDEIIAKFEVATELSQSMVIVEAEAVGETEKGVQLRVKGHFKARWISRKLANSGENDGAYEVPHWWAMNEFGEAFVKTLPEVA